jgi:hypothetical protein
LLRGIRILGMPPRESEIIGLMAAILGWEVAWAGATHAVRRGLPADADPFGPTAAEGAFVDAAAGGISMVSGGVMPRDAASLSADVWPVDRSTPWLVSAPFATSDAMDHGAGLDLHDTAPADIVPARLVLRYGDGLIQASTDDAELAARMARQGLDRLVLPLSLGALEELLTLAG